jgi:hypothetical protein
MNTITSIILLLCVENARSALARLASRRAQGELLYSANHNINDTNQLVALPHVQCADVTIHLQIIPLA